MLSYRLLGKSQEIRAENSHIFCITANTLDVSPDLVSRSIVINLEYKGDPRRRTFHLADPEGYAEQHRLELLGELIGKVERWKAAGMPRASVHTRFNKRGWGNIVGGILQINGDPDFLTNAEEAAAQLDETRREFAELVGVLLDHAQGHWTAAELAELCAHEGLLGADLGEGTARSLSTKMGTLAGRYINERFGTSDGREVTFLRSEGRKGKLYRVAVREEVPNLDPFAEPLPNLCRTFTNPQVRHLKSLEKRHMRIDAEPCRTFLAYPRTHARKHTMHCACAYGISVTGKRVRHVEQTTNRQNVPIVGHHVAHVCACRVVRRNRGRLAKVRANANVGPRGAGVPPWQRQRPRASRPIGTPGPTAAVDGRGNGHRLVQSLFCLSKCSRFST